jgi:ABC-type antimicrobial peptide transport system permease subunit
LLLGAFGLAVVLLRTVVERRGELALLQALGFRRRALRWLVLSENGLLLVLGLLVGAISALFAVAPQLQRGSQDFSITRIGGLIASVMFVGLTTSGMAVFFCLRASLIKALREE